MLHKHFPDLDYKRFMLKQFWIRNIYYVRSSEAAKQW